MIWLWISRIAVAPTSLIEWDSANYALALVHLDLFNHQPHPPGNPLFVALLEIGSLFPGITAPFLFANGVLGTVSLGLMGWMARPHLGRWGAFGVAAAFAICGTYWFQGASSTAYVAEAAASVIGAAAAVAIATRAMPLQVAVLGVSIAIGLRPNIAITLLPLGLTAWLVARPTALEWGSSIASFTAGCLAWLVPMLALGGGLDGYRRASRALWRWQVGLGSVLGGDGSIVGKNTETLVLYLGDALHLLWLGVALNSLVVLWTRRVDRRVLAFLALWALPGALFFAGHHLPKSGYVLSLVPACFLTAALAFRDARAALEGWARTALTWFNGILVVLWAALNLYGFGYSVPADLLTFRDAPIALPRPVILTGDYGRIGLAYRAWPHRHAASILDRLDDERDLAVFLFGAHELMRVQMAMRPNQWMVATSVDHGAWVMVRNGEVLPRFGDFQEIVLEPPDQGLTDGIPTRVRRRDSVLELARPGRSLSLELNTAPNRIVVFAPCPPCAIAAPAEVEYPAGTVLGGGFLVFEIPAI